jgi:hypothetical protein
VWPFKKKERHLPGFKQHADGQVSFTLTEEEETAIRRFFSMMKSSGDKGELYIHPEAHKAMTAWALIGYSQDQVWRAGNAPSNNQQSCFQNALGSAMKAYSIHPLPIYMFDMAACLICLTTRPLLWTPSRYF